MGAKCALTYANIFMGILEKTNVYPFFKWKMQLFLRYIYDNFYIWTGSENELKQKFFYQKLMRYSPPLGLISTTQKPKYIS